MDQALLKAKSHAKKGDIEEAKKLYKAVLQAFPKNKRAQQGLAALNTPKQPAATQSPPQETINQLINIYNQGQLGAVVEQAQTLTEQYPEAFIIWNILGAANKGLGRVQAASEAFKKVTELNPTYADGFSNLGVTLQEQGKLEKAIGSYKKALSLKPNYAEAYYNMGNALQEQGKLEEAIASYKKALSLKPDYAEAYYNMGNALKDQGKLEEAIEAYNKALAIKPDYAEAHQNLSYALLNANRLSEGLVEYDWRWKTKKLSKTQRHFAQPLWDGKTSLKGKRILIWSEQGVGDTINWSSRLPLVSAQADHCILECPEKLVPLMDRSFPNIEVKPEDRNNDEHRTDFDYHLPLGSLYCRFAREILNDTKPNAFLLPDPIRVEYWTKRLRLLGEGPYLGVSWKSANMSPKRLPNYAPLADWSPIFTSPGMTFINLQYTDSTDDLIEIQNKFGVTVHNFDDLNHFDDLDDVAALCAALDIVVSTKITVPLISAGVGTATKLANWRQSPWNNTLFNPVGPSINIFERNTWEPWGSVFQLIAKDIKKE